MESSQIRVLAYGGVGNGACDYYRLGAYVEHLAGQNVEVVSWVPQLRFPSQYGDDWRAAMADGRFELALDDLRAGDVLLLSRWRNTRMACTVCSQTFGAISQELHQRVTGHVSLAADPLLRPLLAALLGNPTGRSRCAILYDLDDDFFHQPSWVGHAQGLAAELEVVELLVRLADLVTVSSPVLAEVLAPLSDRILVVRNAIDLSLYPAFGRPGDADDSDTRILFYGAGVRRLDFAVCSEAVDRVTEIRRGTRRLWLGATGDEVGDLVDEVHPYVQAGPDFARKLTDLHPDVGLAPLLDSPFARAKSELHWLEYSAVGAVTVASRLGGAGPYDLIRDGKDGVCVDPAGDWFGPLKRLVRNRSLREDIASRAAERVRIEYSTKTRAAEWSAAFRWASEHPGTAPHS